MGVKKNMTVSLIFRIFGAGIAMLVSFFTARLLDADGRGQLELIRGYPLFLTALGSLSIQQAVRYYAARDRDNEGKYNTAALLLGLALSAVQVIILIPLLDILLKGRGAENIFYAKVFTLIIPLTFLASFGVSAHLGSGRYLRWNFLTITQPTLQGLGLLVLIALGAVSAPSVAMALLFATLGLFLMAMLHLPLSFSGIQKFIRRLLVSGARFSMPTIAQTLLLEMSRLVAIWYLVEEDLGCFAFARTLANQVLLLAFPFTTIGFVTVAEQREPGKQIEILMRLFRSTQAIMLPASILVIFTAPVLVRLLLPESFIKAGTFAQLLVLSCAINAVSNSLDNGLRAMNKISMGSYGSVAGTIVLLASSYPLSKSMGGTGLALATILAALTRMILMTIIVKHDTGVSRSSLWGIRISVYRDLTLGLFRKRRLP